MVSTYQTTWCVGSREAGENRDLFFLSTHLEGEVDNSKNIDIKPNHVKFLYGVMKAQIMLQGNTSVKNVYSV